MMLSRMADALFWMSRCIERADNTARLVEINLLHLIGLEEEHLSAEQWEPLLTIAGSTRTFSAIAQSPEINKASVVSFLIQERANPNSIHSSIRVARENARVVRDRISKEMWAALNGDWLVMDAALRKSLLPERAPAFCTRVHSTVARFQGLSDATMMGGEAYGFYRLGLFMERADMTARILDVKYHILLPDLMKVGSPLDYYQWGALLKSLSGFEAFRRLYHVGIRPIDVTEFVIFNPDFPRSLAFCLQRMKGALEQVLPPPLESDTGRALGELLDLLTRHSPESVFQNGLHEFLQEFLWRLAVLNSAVQSNYFEPNLGGHNALLH